MATFRHVETGKRFFFIHIPRTAGRFIERNLESQGWIWDDKVNVSNMYQSINGIEVAHFHREYYQQYLDVKNIPHVSIIRNPIERFISSSFFLTHLYGNDIQELMEDPMHFFSMIENYPLEESRNWFRNQVDFLSDKTHVWKFEAGFGNDFSEWLSQILEIEVSMNQELVYTKRNEGNKLDKTPALIDNIRQLYRQDIGKLYPELATPQ
jgi:hypothetical protein